ncbi:MAG: hypothetical protein DBX55_08140 [Verrucomicrobia bacterium]|nr:MAG: hypothetical protein DBX55_08140 [Verrucomicrobiota bacterium]
MKISDSVWKFFRNFLRRLAGGGLVKGENGKIGYREKFRGGLGRGGRAYLCGLRIMSKTQHHIIKNIMKFFKRLYNFH